MMLAKAHLQRLPSSYRVCISIARGCHLQLQVAQVQAAAAGRQLGIDSGQVAPHQPRPLLRGAGGGSDTNVQVADLCTELHDYGLCHYPTQFACVESAKGSTTTIVGSAGWQ